MSATYAYLAELNKAKQMQKQQQSYKSSPLRPTNVPVSPLNGGLYTGEAFNGPWGNVPVIPDGDYMTHVNLASANGPSEALKQYAGGPRQGNNDPRMPGVVVKNAAFACNQ